MPIKPGPWSDKIGQLSSIRLESLKWCALLELNVVIVKTRYWATAHSKSIYWHPSDDQIRPVLNWKFLFVFL